MMTDATSLTVIRGNPSPRLAKRITRYWWYPLLATIPPHRYRFLPTRWKKGQISKKSGRGALYAVELQSSRCTLPPCEHLNEVLEPAGECERPSDTEMFTIPVEPSVAQIGAALVRRTQVIDKVDASSPSHMMEGTLLR